MRQGLALGFIMILAGPAFAQSLQDATVSGSAVPNAATGKRTDCTAVVNAAALKAVAQAGPIGQEYTSGDPVAFGPELLRVEVNQFPGGQYAVDVRIDRGCKVLSVSTERESNGPP